MWKTGCTVSKYQIIHALNPRTKSHTISEVNNILYGTSGSVELNLTFDMNTQELALKFHYRDQDWLFIKEQASFMFIFDDGDIIKGENIVLTGESSTLAENIKYEYNSVNTIYFATENEIENGDYIHLFPEDDLINNIAIPSSISSAYSDGLSHLISITILEYDHNDIELIKNIQKRLSNYYGGEPGSFDFLRTLNITKATIKQPVGYFDRQKIIQCRRL